MKLDSSMIRSTRPAMMLLILLLVTASMNLAAAESGQPEENPISDTELEEIYRSQSVEDQRVIDQWADKDRHQYLKTLAEERRRVAEDEATTPVADDPVMAPDTSFVPYEVNPLLRQAFEAYNDEKRPRDDAIALFEQHLEENPDTPFKAEIYFRIGALYSIHQREGEPRRNDLQVKYYTMAHQIWGDKFNYHHKTAWATLANRSRSLPFKKLYYDWLQNFQSNVSPDNVHLIRDIEQTFDGRNPTLDRPERTEIIHVWNRSNLKGSIETAEDNILHDVSNHYDSLADLAVSYPDTRLGQQAARRLDRLDRESSNGALRVMNDPAFLEPYVPEPVNAPSDQQANVSAAKTSPPGGSGGQVTVEGGRWLMWLPALGILVTAGAVVALLLMVRARHGGPGREGRTVND